MGMIQIGWVRGSTPVDGSAMERRGAPGTSLALRLLRLRCVSAVQYARAMFLA